MTNNPWGAMNEQPQMQPQMPANPYDPYTAYQPQQMQQQAPPQQPEQYPTMPNQYGLGTQQTQSKNEMPSTMGVSTSPWLWSGESNSR